MSLYKYSCDECNAYVKTYTPQKCGGCSINLCNNCVSNHKFKLCKWCEEEIPPDLKAKRKTAIILMIFTPILLLMLPVPIPAVYMLFASDGGNQLQILLIFIFIVVSLIAYPMIIARIKKKIIKTLSSKNRGNPILSKKMEET